MRWYITLFALVLFLVGVESAQACSCVPPPPPAEAVAASDAVFVGQVIKTRRDGALFATFRVQQIVKGDLGTEVVIATMPNTAACGVPFQQGQQYLVYATISEGQLSTHLCTRTARIEDASTDIEELEIADLPDEDDDAPRGGCGGLTNVAALQGMFFIFLWIGFRRRKHV